MKKAYLMMAINCHGCGLVANLNPPSIFATEGQMIQASADVHKASRLVCTKPMYVIMYNHVLVSNELLIQPVDSVKVEKTDVVVQAKRE